jgi:hypothetical protein
MANPTLPPPAPATGRGWLPWLLVGALAIAVAVLVTVLLLRDDTATDEPDVLPTPTEEGPPASPEPSPEPEPSDQPTSAMPLLGPTESRFIDNASAIPTSEDSLEDGDYFGYLHGVDPGAGTVEFDVAIMYVGPAAIDWLTANDPGAENPPPNDYIIVNEVERSRTLPLTDDVLVWNWCIESAGGLGFVERTVAQWAAAPATGDPLCEAGADALPRDPANLYWFDVRGNVVQQVVGQFVP